MFDKIIVGNGQIRPFFRFLLSVVGILTVITSVAFIVVKMPPIEHLDHRISLLFWYNLLMLPSLLALYMLLTRLLEQRPLASVGLAFYGRWINELGIGLVAGAGMIVAVACLERLLGVARFSLTPVSPEKVVIAGVFLFALLAVAAVDEELVFRGYPFQRLVDSGGPLAAVAAISVLFGVTHLGNPFHTWISTANTILVGVLLAVCYLRTRALWLPIGVHFAWNYFQGYVLGFPVSGLTLPEPILAARIRGPVWLTGGAYGPEGSILTLGIIFAGTVYFLLTRRIYITREMRELALGPGTGGKGENAVALGTAVPTEKP
ncbi:MAG TPA: CPBP family intramembrane glutamic endopeptidase [Terriglobia bacterium]|nr:CPBP family intramembrane glutamic endopeptidase [Terriglobia bacterium]